MRNDLQKRVLVVATLLERIAGPTEVQEVVDKITRLTGAISAGISGGTLTAEQLQRAAGTLMNLNKMLLSMAAKGAVTPPAVANGLEGI